MSTPKIYSSKSTYEMSLASGERIRIWRSIDKPGKLCIDVLTQNTFRVTKGQARKIAEKILKFARAGQRDTK